MKYTAEQVYELLRNNNVWADAYDELGMIAVKIEWGDWKHDHLRAKWIMEDNGFDELFVKITAEDGSDAYSAIHYFAEHYEEPTAEELAEFKENHPALPMY